MTDGLGDSTKRPLVLVLGDWDRAEMARVKRWIERLGASAEVRHQVRLTEQEIAGEFHERSPDLVVVCQSWPDEFPASEVSAALGRWPLTLWVCCYGAWCDSDGRTRSIWPISVRASVAEAESRLNHVWRIIVQHDGEPLPLTASRDEAFEFDHCDSHARPL